MQQPLRIERKRTKGWRMPENTVSVTRPGKWGNPFKVGDYVKIGGGGDGWKYIKTLIDSGYSYIYIENVEHCIELYKKYITNYPPKDLHELKGKNLACFCKIGSPCHADILLKLANEDL